jgi:hypothetical protein
MENGGPALKQRESIQFGDFWHINDDFAIKMLQRPFPKLKKHHPTNLYILYPMAQSVGLVFVEVDKQMPPQWHCPLSIVHCPLSIVIGNPRNHFSIQILNFETIIINNKFKF